MGTTCPQTPAGHEAYAARLRRGGFSLRWGEAICANDISALSNGFRAWGTESIQLWRTHPELLTDITLGCWFQSRFRDRVA